jgi:hypothetical protein
MSSSIVATPAGYLTLNEARDLIPQALAAIEDSDQRPGKHRSKKASKAAVLRKAILDGDLTVVARGPDGALVPLNMSDLGSLVQPSDGTVFTFAYLRAGSRAWQLVPDRMRGWLRSAELFVEIASLTTCLQKRQTPRGRPGRPFRTDALSKAEEIVRGGKWSPLTDKIGRLHQLLNGRGVLEKPISLKTTSRLAQHHLGYLPRLRPRRVP